MSGEIIAVGGRWTGWEWYALQRVSERKARIGLLLLGGNQAELLAEENVFFERMHEQNCHPTSGADEKWILRQDIILLPDRAAGDQEAWQNIIRPLREWWQDGGVLLAEGRAAGHLFSNSIFPGGDIFHGEEFLQGSFCPAYEKIGEKYEAAVQDGRLSSGWAAERWAGLHFRGRHLWRALLLDETSRALKAGRDGIEEISDVLLVQH